MMSWTIGSIAEILNYPGNDTCADCNVSNPSWASCGPAVFVCNACAEIHSSLRLPSGRPESVPPSAVKGDWSERHWIVKVALPALVDNQTLVQVMASGGNEIARRYYEALVPISYRRPSANDAHVLRQEWIRSKYERLEFVDMSDRNALSPPATDRQLSLSPARNSLQFPEFSTSRNPQRPCDCYQAGYKSGYLWKRGLKDRKFNQRWFVLDETENTLRYYNQQNMHEPKGTYRVDDINVVLIPEKLRHPYAMQIVYEGPDRPARNLYVYADTGKQLMEWYSCIRWVKLNRLMRNNPNRSPSELVPLLTRDFAKEGWIGKTGPKQTASYRRRWMTLDGRQLRYFKDTMDAFHLGEITLGTADQGYDVIDGVLLSLASRQSNELLVAAGITPSSGNASSPANKSSAFTLITPKRHYRFMADSNEDKSEWITSLIAVIRSSSA